MDLEEKDLNKCIICGTDLGDKENLHECPICKNTLGISTNEVKILELEEVLSISESKERIYSYLLSYGFVFSLQDETIDYLEKNNIEIDAQLYTVGGLSNNNQLMVDKNNRVINMEIFIQNFISINGIIFMPIFEEEYSIELIKSLIIDEISKDLRKNNPNIPIKVKGIS